MAGDRFRLEVKERERLGSPESRRLRKQGFVPGVLYGKTGAKAFVVSERDLRAALTGSSGLHAVLDVVRRGSDLDALVDPEGVPARSDPRPRPPHRPARGPARRRDPGDRQRPPPRRRGRTRREGGRRALAAQLDAQRRGAADGGPGEHRGRRQPHGDGRRAPARRPAQARGRHLPRRPARDRHRHRLGADRRGRARARGGRGARGRRGGRGRRGRGCRGREPPRVERPRATPRPSPAPTPRANAPLPSGGEPLDARSSRRRSRQPGPRARTRPAQRRLAGRRRAGAPSRRLVQVEVLRAARGDSGSTA